MKIEQNRWTEAKGWEVGLPGELGKSSQLVLIFGATSKLKEAKYFHEIKKAYPNAYLLGCSTAGEIYGTEVSDETLVATAVHFESSHFKHASIGVNEVENSVQAGERLTQSLDKEGLVHVFVLTDGLKINGSELVKGLTQNLPEGVSITGGLSGDGARFEETLVLCDRPAEGGVITALGLYGKGLKVGYGSLGGWDSFGPERLITRSKGNILYELDGKSALELYKDYLGEHAKGLPSSGFLFPLSIRTKEEDSAVVRTVLTVNEKDQSMTFAGDMPEGAYGRFMKANFDHLIDGSTGAAKISNQGNGNGTSSPDLAILISCVGRKLVLKQRTEEEVEGVRDVLGEHTAMTGFYSYGELSPFTPNSKCVLHNQTMTITTLSEH